MKKKLAISFSGGRTSAVMTKLCVDKFKHTHDIAILFANTGSEHENTLKFVNDCDINFKWNVVWIEADVNPEKGKGIRHKVVNYESASRKGEPLEADFSKHGISGPGYPHCTRDTKEYPIHSYINRQLGWKRNTYYTAIGIRSDEADRISKDHKEKKYIYPLIDAGWNKQDVLKECKKWSFDLDLKGEHYGNCVWCWKKSTRKLLTLAKDDPSIFDFAKSMEDKYSDKIINSDHKMSKRHFFRNRMTVNDIIKMSKEIEFTPYSDSIVEQLTFEFYKPNYDINLDEDSSCGASCEIY